MINYFKNKVVGYQYSKVKKPWLGIYLKINLLELLMLSKNKEKYCQLTKKLPSMLNI